MAVIFRSFVIGVSALAILAGTAFAGDSVVIKGSTTVLPIAQVALEAYMKAHPGVNISLSGAGSRLSQYKVLCPYAVTTAYSNGLKSRPGSYPFTPVVQGSGV
jgi:ABC-type phosphate transport system substrate-binding protein